MSATAGAVHPSLESRGKSSNISSLITNDVTPTPIPSVAIKDTKQLVLVTTTTLPSKNLPTNYKNKNSNISKISRINNNKSTKKQQVKNICKTPPVEVRSSKFIQKNSRVLSMKAHLVQGPKGPSNNSKPPINTNPSSLKAHTVLGSCGGVLKSGNIKGVVVPTGNNRRSESPDVTEGIRVIRNNKGGSDGSSSGGSSSCSDLEEEEEEDDEVRGQRLEDSSSSSSRSSTNSERTFSKYPPQLDFMGSNEKSSKRRTDRYDSSESSDSGVATLSPSASDSSAESSVSPYSPCSYDLSSDGSSSSITSSTGSGGVGLASSCSSPSTLNVSTTPPPPTLHPQINPPATLLGHPIMTAVSAVLSSSANNKGSAAVTTSNNLPVTNYISFQVPNKSHTPNSNQQQSPRKPINFKNSINSKLNSSPLKGTTAKTLSKTESIQVVGSSVKIPATANSTNSNLPTNSSAKNSGVKSNCDAIRPSGSQKLNCATLSKLNSSIITTTGSIQSTATPSSTPKTVSTSGKNLSTGPTGKSKGTIKNIFAVALNFQQQQQKTKAGESLSTSPASKTIASSSSNASPQKLMTTTTTINNNNSTTLNKNHTNLPSSNSVTSNNASTDLKLTNMKQPYVKVTNIKGVSSTTKNGTKSFILHGEGQKNKVIIVSLASSKGEDSKKASVQSSTASAVVQSPSDLLKSKSATSSSPPSSPQVIKVLAAKSLVSPLSYSNNNNNVVVVKSTAVLPTSSEPRDRPTSPKKPRLTSTSSSSSGVHSPSPSSSIASPKKVSHNLLQSSSTTESSSTSLKVESIKTEKVSLNKSSISGSPTSSTKKSVSGTKQQEEPSSPSSLVIDKVRNRKRKLTCCSESGGCGGSEPIGRQFLLFESSSSLLVNSSVSSSSSSGTVTSVQKSCFSLSASNLSAPGPFSSSLGDNAKQPETPTADAGCLWKSCCTSGQLGLNLLEHIQTVHVTGQMKSEGYVCLWEGCKVYNKKSSSLSWLERHVLSHSGNKPFKCIFPGCGLSFSAHGALQRHVNSHISTNGVTGGPNGGSSMTNRKLDSSPLKASRRKKQRCRKQRLNIGQYVDYFDKRVMEVIKHRLANSVDFHTVNAHDCTFRGQVVARRTAPNHETQVLVHWFPESIISDEWVAENKFEDTKLVPLTRIPKEKLSLLFPTLLPPPKREKQSRKLQSSSSGSSTSSAYGSASPSPLTLSSSSPSPSSFTDSDCLMDVVKSDLFTGKLDEDEGIANCERKRRRRKSPFANFDQFDEEDDWAMDLLRDEMFPQT